MIFIVDTNVEELAVKEAIKLNIPIVGIIDTNSDPTGINFPIPGNDDARRAINLYCELVKQTILDAQKNIPSKDSDEANADKQAELPKSKATSEPADDNKSKNVEPKKKTNIVKKKTKSIISKIKSLASKK